MSERLCKALILDGDPDVLTVLEHVLEGAGIDTTITWNYVEARELAQNRLFDVILIGGCAPQFTAETFWRDFQAKASSCSYLLLGASEGDAEHLRGHGIAGVVPKRDPLRVLEEVQKCWRAKTVNEMHLHAAVS